MHRKEYRRMKGNLKMAENEKATCQCADDSLTFENLLAELRAIDNKDRTKTLIDAQLTTTKKSFYKQFANTLKKALWLLN